MIETVSKKYPASHPASSAETPHKNKLMICIRFKQAIFETYARKWVKQAMCEAYARKWVKPAMCETYARNRFKQAMCETYARNRFKQAIRTANARKMLYSRLA